MMTLQIETLHFISPDNSLARQIQIEVCEAITNAIRGWRMVPTGFRTDLSAKIGGIIDKLEQAKLNGKSPPTSELTLPESITKGQRVFGFALHAPFTGVESVVARVKATDIHRNRNPRVEFVVVARAYAYPCGVTSLRVFVCRYS
jgi:hypothetical protein